MTTTAQDRLTLLTQVRAALGETATPEQVQTTVEFVLTGRTPIDPAGLERAAQALAEARNWSWNKHEVRTDTRGLAVAAITAYLAPATN